MLLLLDLLLSPILESPLHDISLRGGALDVITLVELAPELMEVLQLDQVPDLRERSCDDCAFGDGRGGWDAGSHGELLVSVEEMVFKYLILPCLNCLCDWSVGNTADGVGFIDHYLTTSDAAALPLDYFSVSSSNYLHPTVPTPISMVPTNS